MIKSLTENQFRALTCLAVVIAGLVAYANTFAGEFVWDDASSVLLHKHVQDPAEFFQLFREDQHPFGRGQGNFYRPLVAASFMLDYAISRPSSGPALIGGVTLEISPFIFHLTNLIWHLAATLIFFALLTRLGAPRFVRLATVVLYAVHPLHTEAVAYISGRADQMSAAFIFAALWFALSSGTSSNRILGASLSALSFALALICKESALITPFLLLAFVAAPKPAESESEGVTTPISRPWLSLGLTALLLGIYAALRATVLSFTSDTQSTTSGLGERLVQVGQAFAEYVRLIFLPTGLHMERTLDGVPSWYGVIGYALLLLCVLVIVGAFVRRQRRLFVAMAIFLITWIPISGVFPLNAPMAEHWMYVPLAGFLWALFELLWLMVSAAPVQYVVYPIVYAACVLFIAMTANRNLAWRSNESLYLDTLSKNPKSTRIEYNLAVTYQDLLQNPIAARRHFENVVDLYKARKSASGMREDEMYWDEELESHYSLGLIYLQERSYDRAAPQFAMLLGVSPTDENRAMLGRAALSLGQCYIAAGQIDDAKKFLKKAGELSPEVKPEIQHLISSLSAKQSS